MFRGEMKKGGLKWSPAVPVRKPDNIMSSKARENGECGFTPSYENERNENMNFIMSNEYMRMWFKERDVYSLESNAKEEVETGAGDIKRRYVQRFMQKKKKTGRRMPCIKLKRFQNVPTKLDTKRPEGNPPGSAQKQEKVALAEESENVAAFEKPAKPENEVKAEKCEKTARSEACEKPEKPKTPETGLK